MKRRWTVPVRDLAGQQVYFTISVPRDGQGIHASAPGRPSVVIPPCTVEAIRQAMAEARAVWIYERGEWGVE